MDVIESIDLSLMNWLRSVESPGLDVAMAWISSSAGGGLLWLALAIVAFMRPRDRAAAWRVILTVALCYVVVDAIVKPLVGRPRPTPHATAAKRELPPMPRSYSFPSGHAAATFGAVVSVSRMWPQTRIVWWTLAILIGYSRVYLGHHYPLDVVGGALLGIGIAYWVLGGRHPATFATTLPAGVVIKP
jgi:undecaprenyl-diphosphatase